MLNKHKKWTAGIYALPSYCFIWGMGFVLRWVAPILKMTARPIIREKSELNCLDDIRARLLQRFF